MRAFHNIMGGVIDPHAAYLVLRGLKVRGNEHDVCVPVQVEGQGQHPRGHTCRLKVKGLWFWDLGFRV